ncbi:MAG: glycosyltransferase family 39 protein [Anaerolineales bacterium]|nr:glycosyltransferase family 39 protein [Anaerolineales bacterium]
MSTAKRKPGPKPKSKPKASPANEIEFSIKPNTKTTVTIEAGKEKEGKVQVRIRVDGEKIQHAARLVEVGDESLGIGARIKGVIENSSKLFFYKYKNYDIAISLFVGAIILYLVTRLVGLDQYPIYFFTDEAFQTQAMDELITMKYRDVQGTLLPAYFGNGMGLTVYLQWIPLLLFGKSAVLTRVISVTFTMIAAIAVGIILRDGFKLKYWWSGTILLSITPAWFLHTRTAFETAVFVAFYAGALCSYLLYRYRSPRYLYLAIFFGALAFYSYNPAQLTVPVTALILLVSDWRYHWENRHTAVRAGFLLAVLVLPYLRFRIDNPNNSGELLHLLGSYLVSDMPISEKIRLYISEYFFGLSAWYWYIPNNRDQIRHIMKDYGHIMLATLPFALLGLAYLLRHLRDSASRAILLVMLLSPIGGAMVQIGITRSLMFVVPAAILTAIGLDSVLRWIEQPSEALKEASNASKPTSKRILASLYILLGGVLLAAECNQLIDSFAIMTLAVLLGFHGLGLFDRFKQWLGHARFISTWKVPHLIISLALFVVLAGANIFILVDALKNGAFWTKEYTELQYGAFQIYDIIEEYHQEHPEARIILTSSWANGADVLNRFFLGVQPWLDTGSIEGYMLQKFPVDENTMFIMVPLEYSKALKSDKLTDIRVEKTIPYPDGTPAFYLVHLRYVDNIDEIFAAEQAARAILQEGVVIIDGQEVAIRHSYLEALSQSDSIRLLFDDDPLFTYAKTFESNPFIIELTFPSPRLISGFSITVGSTNAQIKLNCYPTLDAEPVTYTFEGKASEDEPVLSFEFPEPTQVQTIHLEMLDPNSPLPAQIHIWELKFAFND